MKSLTAFFIIALMVALVPYSGCTINFKAKEIELDSKPVSPTLDLSSSYELDSIDVFQKGGLQIWPALNLDRQSPTLEAQSVERSSVETVAVLTSKPG